MHNLPPCQDTHELQNVWESYSDGGGKNPLKAARNNKDPHLPPLDFRNTPTEGLASIAQMLMIRQTGLFFPQDSYPNASKHQTHK